MLLLKIYKFFTRKLFADIKFDKIYFLISLILFVFVVFKKDIYSRSFNLKKQEINKRNTIIVKLEDDSFFLVKLLEDSNQAYYNNFKEIIKSDYYSNNNCSLRKIEKNLLSVIECQNKNDKMKIEVPITRDVIKYTHKAGVVSLLLKPNKTYDIVFIMEEDMSYFDNNPNMIIIGYVVKDFEVIKDLNKRSKIKEIKFIKDL